jgi:hypothetical protein
VKAASSGMPVLIATLDANDRTLDGALAVPAEAE